MSRDQILKEQGQAALGACVGQQIHRDNKLFAECAEAKKPLSRRESLKAQIAAEEASEREHEARRLSLSQVYAGIHAGFVGQISTLQDAVYSWNQHQGFWDNDQYEFGTKIALIHSELSEALEADRKQIASDEHIPQFTGVEAELAGAIIRILDLAGSRRARLAEAVIAKLQFNLTRPHRHNKLY